MLVATRVRASRHNRESDFFAHRSLIGIRGLGLGPMLLRTIFQESHGKLVTGIRFQGIGEAPVESRFRFKSADEGRSKVLVGIGLNLAQEAVRWVHHLPRRESWREDPSWGADRVVQLLDVWLVLDSPKCQTGS